MSSASLPNPEQALRRLIERFPGDPIAEMAQRKLGNVAEQRAVEPKECRDGVAGAAPEKL